MGDDGGAARVAEPTSLAAAAQPFAQNRRRQSARLNEDEDVELAALTEAQLPADSQRNVLDAKPVDEEDLLELRPAHCRHLQWNSASRRQPSLHLVSTVNALCQLTLCCADAVVLLCRCSVQEMRGLSARLRSCQHGWLEE